MASLNERPRGPTSPDHPEPPLNTKRDIVFSIFQTKVALSALSVTFMKARESIPTLHENSPVQWKEDNKEIFAASMEALAQMDSLRESLLKYTREAVSSTRQLAHDESGVIEDPQPLENIHGHLHSSLDDFGLLIADETERTLGEELLLKTLQCRFPHWWSQPSLRIANTLPHVPADILSACKDLPLADTFPAYDIATVVRLIRKTAEHEISVQAPALEPLKNSGLTIRRSDRDSDSNEKLIKDVLMSCYFEFPLPVEVDTFLNGIAERPLEVEPESADICETLAFTGLPLCLFDVMEGFDTQPSPRALRTWYHWMMAADETSVHRFSVDCTKFLHFKYLSLPETNTPELKNMTFRILMRIIEDGSLKGIPLATMLMLVPSIIPAGECRNHKLWLALLNYCIGNNVLGENDPLVQVAFACFLVGGSQYTLEGLSANAELVSNFRLLIKSIRAANPYNIIELLLIAEVRDFIRKTGEAINTFKAASGEVISLLSYRDEKHVLWKTSGKDVTLVLPSDLKLHMGKTFADINLCTLNLSYKIGSAEYCDEVSSPKLARS
ncbi:hypothetical protein HYFRA_00007759 [Hymenoscyphus fraxineus]|uniref:Uncharacterized protein n=1 Tax=Hymenoscyphus fraxineus TaxID=746836 RepID=A0A9N9KQ17_9HELO|nr:hypothetical protein HYFRA_00007759 [Hymenoscyphus fraxineus]